MIPLLANYHQLVATLKQTATNQHKALPQLMAVSKTQSPENLAILLAEGHRLFGESRVQEAAQKWPSLKKHYPDSKLHLIGPLQTNKVKQAVLLFDMIETLDRPALAQALAKAFATLQVRCPLLIQVNTGGESQKTGVLPQDFESLLNKAQSLNLPVVGLMCVPPVQEDPAPHFAYLHSLATTHKLPYLSMGMSHDYQIAIQFNTSWVRVGTALFGPRDLPFIC